MKEYPELIKKSEVIYIMTAQKVKVAELANAYEGLDPKVAFRDGFYTAIIAAKKEDALLRKEFTSVVEDILYGTAKDRFNGLKKLKELWKK